MLMIELAVTAVLAVGMLLVILPGQIDLSAGSGVGLTGGRGGGAGLPRGLACAGGPGPGDSAGAPGLDGDGPPDRPHRHSGLHRDARRPAGLSWALLADDPQQHCTRCTRRHVEPVRALSTSYVPPSLGTCPGSPVHPDHVAAQCCGHGIERAKAGPRRRDGRGLVPEGVRGGPGRVSGGAGVQPVPRCSGGLPDPVRRRRSGARCHAVIRRSGEPSWRSEATRRLLAWQAFRWSRRSRRRTPSWDCWSP